MARLLPPWYITKSQISFRLKLVRGNVLYLGVVRDRFICIGDRDIAILSPHNSAPGELLLRESAGILPIYALGYIYCVLCIAYLVLCPFESTLNIVFLPKSTLKSCVFQWKGETLAFAQLLHIPLVLTSTDNSETFVRLVWAHIYTYATKSYPGTQVGKNIDWVDFQNKKTKSDLAAQAAKQ